MMSMDINNVHGHCGQQKMSMDKCPQDQQDPIYFLFVNKTILIVYKTYSIQATKA
jgi:hypothetical protein